jgi:nucleotide-binding universal stress UspA family protein
VGRIVVGVDGSPAARRAFGWAAAEARLRQAVLEVVHAYHARQLAAPVYFGSTHSWHAAVGAAGQPQVELTASVQAPMAPRQHSCRRALTGTWRGSA